MFFVFLNVNIQYLEKIIFILFAKPSTAFCSCITQTILIIKEPITTGTETYPPKPQHKEIFSLKEIFITVTSQKETSQKDFTILMFQ